LKGSDPRRRRTTHSFGGVASATPPRLDARRPAAILTRPFENASTRPLDSSSMQRHDELLERIRAAANRIGSHIRETPLVDSHTVSASLGLAVPLKAENLQRGGSFKLRGALNKILTLDDDERRRGVIAYSAGNHAQGVALAAQLFSVPATIVMPADT